MVTEQRRLPWSVVAVFAFAVFFVLVAVAAVAIGLHDVSLSQAGFGVTAGGVVLVAIGVTLLVAAYYLVQLVRSRPWAKRGRPPCKVVVLAAFFVTMLLGLYVFFVAIGSASAQRPVVLVVGLAFVAVSLLGMRFFATDAQVTLPKVGAAVALGVVGTTIGAWEFWYQNQYIPAHAGRAVALTVALHPDGRQGDFDVVRATIGYQNAGAKTVTVLGSTYTLTGSRVVRCPQLATTARVQGFFDYFLTDPQRTRYMADVWEERPAAVLAAGKFVGDGERLDSSVAFSRDLVFFVPPDRYQLLRLRAQVFAVPGSVNVSQRKVPQYATFVGDNELYAFWHIDDDSWFHDLVEGRERWVVLRYELVDPSRKSVARTSPDLRVTARFPDPTWSQGRPSEATVERLFSGQSPPSAASEPFADTELTLGPVAEPTARDARRLPRCRAG